MFEAALILLAALAIGQALFIRRLRRQLADAHNQVAALEAVLGEQINFLEVRRG